MQGRPYLLKAHPRSRGENQGLRRPGSGREGSSPLTRGKHQLTVSPGWEIRLIPAHAGKTGGRVAGLRGLRAHPRSRGENQPCQASGRPVLGSSPLTRGKPVEAGRTIADARLIPAHAGKTSMADWKSSSDTAHPRSRGENEFSPPDCPSVSGSSPLTRGKQGRTGVGVIRPRLIPAHAGKTLMGLSVASRARAHPRSRGENSIR